MSLSSPLSLACSWAPMKFCGLRNEMQPVRHDMALWVLLRCAQLLLNSIWHALKSCFTVLFLNLLRHYSFFTKLVFITPVSYRLSFQSTYGHPVPDLTHKVLLLHGSLLFLWGSPSLCHYPWWSKAPGVLPGKADKAGTGTSCHCSPRIPVTFTTWVRWHG